MSFLRPFRLGAWLAVPLALGAAWADDWPQARFDAAKTGATTETVSPPLGVLWVRDLEEGNNVTPVTKDGRVYCPAGKVLYCLDAANGAILWQYTAPAGFASTPAVANGFVYAAALDGTAFKLSARKGALNGKPLRQVHLGGTVQSAVMVSDARIAIGVGVPKHEIRLWNVRPPETLVAVHQTVQPAYGAPASAEGRIVSGANDSRFYCLEADGALRWTFGIPTGEVDLVAPALAGGRAFLATSADSTIRALDASTGQTAWAVKPDGNGCKTGSLAVTADRVFAYRRTIGANRNKLFCLDQATGTTLWTWDQGISGVPIPGYVGSPAVAGANVFVTTDTALRVFSTTSAVPLEQHEMGVPIYSSPTPSNGRVHVNARGVLYTYQSANFAPDAPVTGFEPLPGAAVPAGSVTLSWNPSNDLDDDPSSVGYVVRIDNDGEVDLDYDREIAVPAGQTSAIVPWTDLVPDTTVTWRVRARDGDGALSPWSLAQSFFYAAAPGDPGSAPQGLAATPFNQGVALTWRPPLTGVPAHYAVSLQGPGDDGHDVPYWYVDGADPVLVVRGLTNGSTYSFAVSAVPASGARSPAAFVSAVPSPGVKLVSPDGTSTAYDTIRAAADAARAGDTIQLGNATYEEDPIELPADVSIEGKSPATTVIAGNDPTRPVVTVAGGGKHLLESRAEAKLPHLTNLRIQGGDTGVTTEEESGIRVENVVLTGNRVGMAIGAASYAVVKNVTFVANDEDGLHIPSPRKSKIEIRNDIFSGHAKAAVRMIGENAGSKKGDKTTYCVFHANGSTHADGAQSGVGDVAYSGTLFSDSAFHEHTGTPAVDGGKPGDTYFQEPHPNGGRINVGAYGNTPEAAISGALAAALKEEDPSPAAEAKKEKGAAGSGGCFIGASRSR